MLPMRTRFLTFCIALLSATHLGQAADFYASPDASESGNGTIASPWPLNVALGNNAVLGSRNAGVKPGDTVWLMSGHYGSGGAWVVRSELKGTRSAPIVVRRLPGAHVVIDGGISALGEWTTFWGFEISNSSTNRHCTTEYRQPGLNLLGPGHKAVNLLIHDTGHPGIGFWDAVGDGGEVSGCIIWGVGIYSEDPGWNGKPRGSAIYAQNRDGERRILDCIAMRNFQGGYKIYSENGYCNGFYLEGNVSVANGYQGYHIESLRNPIGSVSLKDNIAFNDKTITLGIASVTNQNINFKNNYVVGELYGGYQTLIFAGVWQNLLVNGNLFAFMGTNSVWRDSAQFWSIVRGSGPQVVDQNQYYGGSDSLNNFRLDAFGKISLESVRLDTGWESSGTIATDREPSSTIAFLRPNRHEVGRGHLTIINWAGLRSLPVDLSRLQLREGQGYEIRDAQNLLAPALVKGRFQTSQPQVNVPLENSSLSDIIGDHFHYTTEMLRHTGPLFNVMLILPEETSVSPDRPSAPLELRVK